MSQPRITPANVLLLSLAPVFWASNAVLGRAFADVISPLTLNLLRWCIVFILLLPLAASVLRPDSVLWPNWRRFAMLSLFSVGSYNTLIYMALKTSSAINVTLMSATTPIWMLIIGRLFFSTAVSYRQLLGAAISMLGVVLVLSRGQLQTLAQVQLVPGDAYVLLAAIVWAWYSWMLGQKDPDELTPMRHNWAAFLLAQVVFGLLWSGLGAAAEWSLGAGQLVLSWSLAATLLFMAVGPAILAYRIWDWGVARMGAAVAGFFINLIPLFTALLSSLFLREVPHLYHALSFILIASGILVAARR